MRSEEYENSSRPTRPVVPRTPFCLRLTFRYDLNQPLADVRLAQVERVRTVAPGISVDPPQPGQSGAWFEVRDADGQLLYYSILHDPMPTDTEVFSGAPGEPEVWRVPVERPEGQFSVIVPELPTAAFFSFHASGVIPSGVPSAAKGRRKAAIPPRTPAAQPLAEIPFDELRQSAV